ncbi:MAG: Asp-tRNA(Asn)/Glu-tRNA(Gln) amidotransferase subunit GatB [Anaerolineales bacterium]|nr:Asp-tRNA(Asn)/Glu-tRNA(Gln) amidotransferase subunit GatB [Anaerolineales bacterium]
MEFEPVIGLEVHAQLLTASKMFCGCSADYAGAPPNTHVCPVCLGLPGSLPVINRTAVEYTILTALAFHCAIPEFAKFDRKNYHYPDLMKGYQISQYDLPLSRDGFILIDDAGATKSEIPEAERRVRIGIRRVHLEEDTAKLFHVDGASWIDVNRSGIPLMEIVSEPEMHSVEEARLYSMKLRQILRYLGVCSGDMEKGAMRFEANISLRLKGSRDLSQTRVEIKNLNSLRAMVHATEFEIARHTNILSAGGRVEQETMGWDETRNTTYTQRSKEEAHDYRYFPEPDLPRLQIARGWVAELGTRLPELPDEKRDRLINALGLGAYDASVITAEREVAAYYDRAVEAGQTRGVDAKALANWITGELFRLMKESNAEIGAVKIAPEQIPDLPALVSAGTISNTIAKNVFEEMYKTGEDARAIIAAKGLAQISDRGALESIVEKVLAENPKQVAEYLGGKETIAKFLVGQVMKATKGQAHPGMVNELVLEKLNRMKM